MLKVAYIGGGSLFLPSIFNGLVQEEQRSYILKNMRTSDAGGAGRPSTLQVGGGGTDSVGEGRGCPLRSSVSGLK